jgi:hypothetical protein
MNVSRPQRRRSQCRNSLNRRQRSEQRELILPTSVASVPSCEKVFGLAPHCAGTNRVARYSMNGVLSPASPLRMPEFVEQEATELTERIRIPPTSVASVPSCKKVFSFGPTPVGLVGSPFDESVPSHRVISPTHSVVLSLAHKTDQFIVARPTRPQNPDVLRAQKQLGRFFGAPARAPLRGLKREEGARIPPARAGGKQSATPLGVERRIARVAGVEPPEFRAGAQHNWGRRRRRPQPPAEREDRKSGALNGRDN